MPFSVLTNTPFELPGHALCPYFTTVGTLITKCMVSCETTGNGGFSYFKPKSGQYFAAGLISREPQQVKKAF